MSRRLDLAAAVPVVALLAVVSAAALPGPRPVAPRVVAAPAAPTTTAAPQAEEVRQIISDLNAVQSDAGLVVPLPEQVLFDFGLADVRADATPTLSKVAQLLTYYGRANVEVRGHTDDVGDNAFNLALSERRAGAVRDYLVGVSGVTAERFVVQAFGETQPVVPNDSDEHRQQNRRVEVVVLG